jgi:competence protein ComGC
MIASRRRAVGLTKLEVLLIITILFMVIIGMMIPATAKVREAAAHALSKNNLRQIGAWVSRFNELPSNKLPPAYGVFQGQTGSVFYHIRPRLEDEQR